MSPQSWNWRKNYRIWEANRKVFLYPENWIEPDLRPPQRAMGELLEVASAARAGRTSALLTAASSTAAIVAARAVAEELGRDLYRIDLSRVVSKFIGETEKHLDLIFGAAESLEVVLLFDEADALFGKRSDAKDTDDRYINAETSYLLQRMEVFDGLVMLASNWRGKQVEALRRRIRFLIEIPL
jgi:SpoVK/Ycf46/Vps4 family AAA+-type ATPase